MIKVERHQKLRLQEFNKFDVERILKEVITQLGAENDKLLKLIDQHGDAIDEETLEYFLEEVANNAAQVVRISSLLFYKDDIYNFFSSGPLIRKDEVET